MRADRLLSIVWLLRTHERLTTAELARRLEVSRRTIMRDVEALSSAGVPVYCERGPRGGVTLLPGYRTDVTALSSEESRALFAGVTTWGASSLGLGDALASALRKLLAAVPDAHRADASNLSDRVVIDPHGWLPQPERERTGEVFHTVREAVLTQRRLCMEYRSKSRAATTTSTVDPHGLVGAGNSWYLCSSVDEEVLFTKISRIEEARIQPEACRADRTVDVEAAWHEHRERFLDTFVPVTATAWIRETRWSDAHEWAISATRTPPPTRPPSDTGWGFLRLEFLDHLHAMTVLLRLGPDAVLETPQRLRHDLTGYLTETLDHYR